MMSFKLRSSSWQFFSLNKCIYASRSLQVKRCCHEESIFAFDKLSRPSVAAIVNCYQNRMQLQEYITDHQEKSLTESIEDPVFHVTIGARPDEFHKLLPKCSACGSILQTKHETQSGFIPEKKFVGSLQRGVLDKVACFNCYMIRYHNSPVKSGVNSNDAINQLNYIKKQTALILYVVDLFDIEGTMMSNILELIGQKKRIIIVGNKLDRIPLDENVSFVRRQVESMKIAVKNIAFKNGLENCNLKDICLVSAKTGYGLNTLIEKINKHRDPYMNVYLVGCTNTGKSTLYNLIINMLNVHRNNDTLPAQAIEHHLPGTTNSFVRESISESKFVKLARRLKEGPEEYDEVFNFDDELLDFLNVEKKNPKYQQIGRSTKQLSSDQTLLGINNSIKPKPLEIIDDDKFLRDNKSCFIYDTPGILNPSQLIQYLTPSEINYLSPTLWVVPRTFLLKPGFSLCVGALSRLNFLDISMPQLKMEDENLIDSQEDVMIPSNEGIYITAMISPNVLIHVTKTEIAEEKYETWFSNDFFKLPVGSPERFKDYPRLIEHEYTVIGKSRNINACDLVLHGVGWLSVAAVMGSKVSLSMYTPNGEGQNLRLDPFLPNSVKRKKGRGVMYNGMLNRNMYGHTRKRSPQLIKTLEEKYITDKTIDNVKTWKVMIKEKMNQERFQKKEDERLERTRLGIVLGRKKALMEKEEKFRLMEESNYAKRLEGK